MLKITLEEALRLARKANKYGAKKYKGYDSKGEYMIARELLLKQKAGLINDYQEQVKIPLLRNDSLVCYIIVDFTYLENGEFVIHEYKGVPTPAWRIKWKLLKAQMKGKGYIFRITTKTETKDERE